MHNSSNPPNRHQTPDNRSRRLPTVNLQICRGRAKHLRRPVRVPVFVIGSAPDCDLVIGDEQFPEVHSYLFIRPRGVSVRRVANGPVLHVNGHPTRSAQLQNGDRLAAGKYEFQVDIQFPIDEEEEGTSHWFADTMDEQRPTARGFSDVQGLLQDIRADLGLPATTDRPLSSVVDREQGGTALRVIRSA